MLPTLKTEWLFYFDTLLSTGSFSAAAELLAISPQNLRHNIRQLEQALETELIDRTQKNTPTPAGLRFGVQARELLQEFQAFKNDFQQSQKKRVLGCLLPHSPYLHLLKQKPPNHLFDYDLITGFETQAQILEALLSERIEIGVLQTPLRHQALKTTRVACSGWILGAQQGAADWRELGYICYHQRNELHDLFWPEQDFPRRLVAETSSLDLAKSLCIQGFGALYLPDSLAWVEVQTGLLFELAQAPFQLPPLYLAERK
jgi:DNA-binding transcriptional LysR family regulator